MKDPTVVSIATNNIAIANNPPKVSSASTSWEKIVPFATLPLAISKITYPIETIRAAKAIAP